MKTLSEIPDFVPHPLLRGGHLQTIATRFFKPQPPPAKELTIELEDGDRLIAMASYPAGWESGDPILVLVHGMAGSSRSAYLVRMAKLAMHKGIAAVRVNLRNSGEGAGLAKKPYHSGRSGDIRAVLYKLMKIHEGSDFGLIGYSLGGNISLKLAGELPQYPIEPLKAVVAVAAPIDLACCADALALPKNRIYEHYFLRALIAEARRQSKVLGIDTPNFGRKPSIRKFDDVWTAPQSGFAGAEDYYRQSSSGPLLSRIPIPTLLIAAKDDPFVPFSMYEKARLSPQIRTSYSSQGGHCGFIGGFPGFRFWAEEQAVGFVARVLGQG